MYPPPAPRGAVVQCYPRSARAARPSSSRPSSPKPGQRRGSHFLCHRAISPSLGSPLQSRSLGNRVSRPGLVESEDYARDPRGHFGCRVANAARGSRLRHPPTNESPSGDAGGPGCAAPTGLRLSRCPGLLGCFGLYFAQLPRTRGCVRARVPLLSPLCRLSERGLLGLIGIRNPFNLQRSKLTSARVLAEVGEGRPGRGFQANRKH